MRSFLLSLIFPALCFAEGTNIVPSALQSPLLPMVLIFGIVYFLILRPQQKKAKLHQQFLTDLKRGDLVVTNAGIVGMVKTLGEKLVTLEVDEGVNLKFLRNQISESANSLKDDKSKEAK